MDQCKAQTRSGKRCNGYPVAGSNFCFTHDPGSAPKRKAAHMKGGFNRRRARRDSEFPQVNVQTSSGLKSLIEILIKETYSLENSVNRARAIAYLANLQQHLIDRDELMQRVEALEATMKRRAKDNDL